MHDLDREAHSIRGAGVVMVRSRFAYQEANKRMPTALVNGLGVKEISCPLCYHRSVFAMELQHLVLK